MSRKDDDRIRERIAAHEPKATPAQVKTLDGLLISCGFSERVQRNAYMSSETGRDIRFIDALTVGEASTLISTLIARRDAEKFKPTDPEEFDDGDDSRWTRRR